MRVIRALAPVVLAALACASQADALPLISHHGRWLTDPQGRVVTLHGVQIDKFIPGQPVEGWIDVSPANVRFIAAEGFNLARVSMAYAGVEPEPGRFDDSYLPMFKRFDHRLAHAGIYDLIDMMQGQYSTIVAGGGFPDWMTQTDGLPNNHAPFALGYIDNLAEDAAWDNFWADAPASDGVGLQEHYARGMRHLAQAFVGAPGLLGFEILNEPWPGIRWPACASPPGCLPGGFDQTSLTAFYRRVISALRSGDPRHLVAYEPNLLFDYGAATQLGRLGDRDLLFAFHNYCLATAPGLTSLPDPFGDCGIEEQLTFGNATARSSATGDSLLMDEWGNSTNLTAVGRMANEADQRMLGWSVWAYEDCCHSPAAIVKDASKPPTARGNLNLAELTALVRPYPKLIAGTPSSWSYNPTSDEFALRYSTRRVGGGSFAAGADTEVELPALRFPTGYAVQVSGAQVLSAPDANVLRLGNARGATNVTATVTAADHHPAGARTPPQDCPAPARHVIRLRRRRRVAIYVDGGLAAVERARRVVLPRGLADGSVIRLHGRRLSLTRRIRGCRLE